VLISAPYLRSRLASAMPAAALTFALILAIAHGALAGPVEDRLQAALGALDTRELKTGVLYDRVLPFSGIERFTGDAGSAVASRSVWRQLYEELRRASADPSRRPAAEDLIERARRHDDAIPLALVFDDYERIRPDALERGALAERGGRLVRGSGQAYERRTAFAAAALREWTYRGADVRFVLARDDYFSNRSGEAPRLEADLGDGVGFRVMSFDRPLSARYAAPGVKAVRVRATGADGDVREASFAFTVRALAAPTPDDTMFVTGTIPYLGGVASGQAYVYLAAGHSGLVNPVVAVEGFDIDNSMNWDELYALLDQQQLIENLRAEGYDFVVLNFLDATDYIQRNAFVLVELLQRLRATLPPQKTVPLAGASMGGLVGRYALAYMEKNGIDHGVRTYISFDGPHLGANIPLGIQYWVKFFSSQSSEAAYLLSRLDRPAARQMLVYHYTDPPVGQQPDPLRTTFLADLDALGGWPFQTRRVAIASGSDHGVWLGFVPSAQIIDWSYSNFLVNVRGNVWAVPNGPNMKIFDGRIRILISATEEQVYIAGTQPYDAAPGGTRATMAEMDAVPAPYGDIVALYPSHCFVPTSSALAYTASDLFHDISADPDPLSHTPFDAIYAQATNQEHIAITAENAAWIRNEVEMGVTAVEPIAGARSGRLTPMPNPSSGPVRVAFALDRPGAVDLRVFALDGREVATLTRSVWDAGNHEVAWSGRDAHGANVRAGVYIVRYSTGGAAETRRIVRLR
jgi:putative serine esterase DUF676